MAICWRIDIPQQLNGVDAQYGVREPVEVVPLVTAPPDADEVSLGFGERLLYDSGVDADQAAVKQRPAQECEVAGTDHQHLLETQRVPDVDRHVGVNEHQVFRGHLELPAVDEDDGEEATRRVPGDLRVDALQDAPRLFDIVRRDHATFDDGQSVRWLGRRYGGASHGLQARRIRT